MTINRALHTILDEVEIDENYSDNNIEFTRSWNYILDRLGVCFDSQTGNFVTQDTGDVIWRLKGTSNLLKINKGQRLDNIQ